MYLRVPAYASIHLDRSPSPLHGRVPGDCQREHSHRVLFGSQGCGRFGCASGAGVCPRVEASRLERDAGREEPLRVVRKHAGDVSLGDRHLRDDGTLLLLLQQARRVGRTVSQVVD